VTTLQVNLKVDGLLPAEIAKILGDVSVEIMKDNLNGNVIVDREYIGDWSIKPEEV
jgi:hypothetical protein